MGLLAANSQEIRTMLERTAAESMAKNITQLIDSNVLDQESSKKALDIVALIQA